MYLTLLNGTGYVFNVEDYMELRRKYHIIGAFVGTANSKGWSSSGTAMPVALTKWETQLLIDEGICVLLSKAKDLTKEPTPESLETYKKAAAARIHAQGNALRAEKLRETERHLDKIVQGKRNKLLKQNKTQEAASLTAKDVLEEIDRSFVFDTQNALVELPCEHPTKHIGQLYTETIFDSSSLKYRVFHELWQLGKFVTAGDAFGADFLVYPGDPMLYHASHIIILQATPVIAPLELIAKVRLSVNVNKSCVFAYEQAENKKIIYQTVAWCNPSK
ncbi:CG33260 [Drosophila busckii]|uniref:tRNA-splicing endonuclease subunit Sen34 n=1 Tax=Drosophila busckii TaxID=30019 RepID=A0A0M4EM16_DROBS|nr:tRNA-splicing endonuclease subunit Sen34 [Drosophila busckii]ALC44610.1 CG33260 [Drosophila busckii]